MGTFPSGCQRQYFLLLAKMCDQTQEYCQPEKLTQAFGVQKFTLQISDILPAWLPFSEWVFSPSQKFRLIHLIWLLLEKLELMWLVSNIINHIVRLSKWPTCRQTKILLSRQDIQGSIDYLPVAEGKGQTSFWSKVNSLVHTCSNRGCSFEWDLLFCSLPHCPLFRKC